jgi:hypothetical protein
MFVSPFIVYRWVLIETITTQAHDYRNFCYHPTSSLDPTTQTQWTTLKAILVLQFLSTLAIQLAGIGSAAIIFLSVFPLFLVLVGESGVDWNQESERK